MEQSNPTECNGKDEENKKYALSKAELPPANPIITKDIQTLNQRVSIKIDRLRPSVEYQLSRKYPTFDSNSTQLNKRQRIKQQQQEADHITLTEQYDQASVIYKRYKNDSYNTRGNCRYIASIFIKMEVGRPSKLPHYHGLIRDDQLEFDSNFESGNLLAVYKKSDNSYDLILQNDVNTNGFTQWFNFKVRNKKNNFVGQFNIVNLYKSQSLYNLGMKPCVHSQKSDKSHKRSWRRKGFNIYYQKNDLSYEDNKQKCYKTLSFQYDFTVQSDRVQFAHAMPYDLQDLRSVLQIMKQSQKVTIKTIGTTIMGRPIPMIKFKSLQKIQGFDKKAIIILSRQHPGQTVGSFIAEQVMLQLLRHSTENDFLVWRFDIYIFPMVNIDGVAIGNYRSNFAGYDLNRCWLKTDSEKHPQVHLIKAQIKKIAKKQSVQLILDLHGHSRKMGSFFYGNNFGTNPMLYPFIASKANSNIVFEDCRFTGGKGAKASTARVVLGNLIKQTGNVYTYEVSFFGNYKNDRSKSFSFNEEHYKQLGRTLVLSMYRTYMQMYKQQKTLKESAFLKNIKKEIQGFKHFSSQNTSSGSDSEAEDAMVEQTRQLEEFQAQQVDQNQKQESIREDTVVVKKQKNQYRLPMDKKNDQIKKKISELLQKNAENGQYLEVKGMIRSRFPSIQNKSDYFQRQQDLQKQLNSLQDNSQQLLASKGGKHSHRLKVYGQTYALKSRNLSKYESPKKDHIQKYIQKHKSSANRSNEMKKSLSKQYLSEQQQLKKSFNTISLNDKSEVVYVSRNMGMCQLRNNQKYKNRNKSLQLKQVSPIFNEQLVNEAVKINKIDKSKMLVHPFNQLPGLNYSPKLNLPPI